MRPIKLLAISASPRKEGNCAFLLNEVLKCINECSFPVDLEKESLAGKRIDGCCGCLACYKNGGCCVIKDDFESLRQKWKDADCVLYCTPVYVAGIPGQLKCFLDRLNNSDFGLPVPSLRYMKTISVISQGGDFFGGGAELTMLDIIRHAAMIKCVFIPPDGSYIASGGWVWDSHTKAMEDKAKKGTYDYELTLKTARSIVFRSVETAAMLLEGAAVLKERLEGDPHYSAFYERVNKKNTG